MNITKKVDIPIMIVYTKNPNNNEESNQNSIKLLIRILTIIVITNINTYLIWFPNHFNKKFCDNK